MAGVLYVKDFPDLADWKVKIDTMQSWLQNPALCPTNNETLKSFQGMCLWAWRCAAMGAPTRGRSLAACDSDLRLAPRLVLPSSLDSPSLVLPPLLVACLCTVAHRRR